MSIKIYEKELLDGLGEKIKASNSFAYVSHIVKDFKPKNSQVDIKNIKALANVAGANPDQPDLYYLYSILVSTGWNGNDDVFIDSEVWAAKNTPVSKGFNNQHDDKYIIGNITSSFVVDENQNVLDDSEERPENYDIVIGAVLYRAWQDEERAAIVEEIIEKSEAGEGFVSMECLFYDFDYAIIDESGKKSVLARDEETSFLTKHLRCFGGEGQFDNFKVGRVLKDITFSGVGFVDNPANERSIVFHDNNPFVGATQASADILQGEDEKMSDEAKISEDSVKAVQAALQSQIDTLQAKNEELISEKEEAANSFAAQTKEHDEKVKSLEATIAEKDEELAKAKEDFEAKTKELDEAKANIEKIETEKTKAERVSKLVEVGVASEDAEKTVEKWAEASDEQFEDIVKLSTVAKDEYPDDEKKDKKDKKDKTKAEDAEASDANEDVDEDVDVEITEDKTQADLAVKEGEEEKQEALVSQVTAMMKSFKSNKK